MIICNTPGYSALGIFCHDAFEVPRPSATVGTCDAFSRSRWPRVHHTSLVRRAHDHAGGQLLAGRSCPLCVGVRGVELAPTRHQGESVDATLLFGVVVLNSFDSVVRNGQRAPVSVPGGYARRRTDGGGRLRRGRALLPCTGHVKGGRRTTTSTLIRSWKRRPCTATSSFSTPTARRAPAASGRVGRHRSLFVRPKRVRRGRQPAPGRGGGRSQPGRGPRHCCSSEGSGAPPRRAG